MRHGRSGRRSGSGVSQRRFSRRSFLRGGLAGTGALFGNLLVAPAARAQGADGFGPLQPADANGLKLPPGFTSRIVATSGQTVSGTSHTWHSSPDGGATFPVQGGGWVYVSNAERPGSNGGVGAIRFDASGAIANAYSILSGTTRNCAGGPTPWNTWLSCEETGSGEVYECDPFTPGSQGAVRPALGVFNHEAAAVDPVHQHVYETEDRGDGLFYRFTPTSYPSLSAGTLEAAEILDPGGDGPIEVGQVRPLAWHSVPDPSASTEPTRDQVAPATAFDGGEGCWYQGGVVYFSTKGDDKVWAVDTAQNTIEIIYDRFDSSNPILRNVDNVYASSLGDVYVAEDPGDLMIVALTQSGSVVPVMELEGVSGSEITGPALSPDGLRLYFSSQRNPGQTFEVSGPFAPTQALPVLGGLGKAMLGAAIAAAGTLRMRAGDFTAQEI